MGSYTDDGNRILGTLRDHFVERCSHMALEYAFGPWGIIAAGVEELVEMEHQLAGGLAGAYMIADQLWANEERAAMEADHARELNELETRQATEMNALETSGAKEREQRVAQGETQEQIAAFDAGLQQKKTEMDAQHREERESVKARQADELKENKQEQQERESRQIYVGKQLERW